VDDLTLLCTSVGNDGFPAVAEAIRDNADGRHVSFVGTDIRENAPGLFLVDQAQVVSRRDAPEHVDEIVSLARDSGADLFLPLSTLDQLFYARSRDRFSVPVVTSSVESLEVAVDKHGLYEFLAGVGLSRHLPRFQKIASASELEDIVRFFGYPTRRVVFKLDEGAGSQGMRILCADVSPAQRLVDRNNRDVTLEELLTVTDRLHDWHPSHVAEYLPGAEYSVDVLCRRGETISAVACKRNESFYGLATDAEVVDEDDVVRAAMEIVDAVGLDYIVNVQFRRDEDGVPKLMEINPRVPGTIGLTVASGVNMPYLALKLALGERFDVPEPRHGKRILRIWGGIYADA
jgi:carbamoyl-phosphate synthase large subunit